MKRLWALLLYLPAAWAENRTAISVYRPYAEQMVEYYAAQYRIPANMIRAVIRVESNWNPGAVSRKGARGMMQLMPGTAHSLDVNHPLWIYQNIGGGTAYLAYLYRRFGGDWRLALAAYNAGPAVVEKRGLRYSSPGVFAYVSSVLAEYRLLLKGQPH
ncbi:MAG: lytic transglycosylase domain-containing protein [Acidobacteriaceae bacterium]|nr:lytic transglycosylase domain-containing protein [Acidobacteriaceae bacterium]